MLYYKDKEVKTRFGLVKKVKEKDYSRSFLKGNYDILNEWFGVSLDYISLIHLVERYVLDSHNTKFFKNVNEMVDNECYNYDRLIEYIEYKKLNPSDSSSEKFYKLKYGYKWEDIRNIVKSKRPNVYDPEYISKRDFISIEEAEEQIKKYKTDKSTSLEGFVKRHGEYKGQDMFKKFQETSSINEEKYIDVYGLVGGKKRWIEYCSGRKVNSPWCKEYWLNKGHTEDESSEFVSEYQKSNSGVSLNYWETKYGYEKGLLIWQKINSKKSVSLNVMIKKYGFDEGLKRHNHRIDAMISTNIEKGIFLRREDKEDFDIYKEKVERYTRMSLYLYATEKFGSDWEEKRGRTKYHIDHRYSKKEGFLNNIEPHIIGNIENLELLYFTINCSKKCSCSITINELYDSINGKYIEGDIFKIK